MWQFSETSKTVVKTNGGQYVGTYIVLYDPLVSK